MRKNLPITNKEVELTETSCILSTTNLKGQISYINQDFIDISGFTCTLPSAIMRRNSLMLRPSVQRT